MMNHMPHDGQLKHYNIEDKIWLWVYNFLYKKTGTSVVVDG